MIGAMKLNRGDFSLYAVFAIFLAANIVLWIPTHHIKAVWGNVPPAPSQATAGMMALGDGQLAYRMTGLMLQNFGNTWGESRNLHDYDYNRLKDWFFMADHLDPVSNFVPSLAAFYFGATDRKDQLTSVIDYLTVVGQEPQPEKWRYLAHAVYLARFKQEDMAKALDLANMLAGLPRDDLPMWAKSMPAFVMTASGDRESAYNLMVSILKTEGSKLNRFEVRFLKDNICTKILTPAQAAQNPLCAKPGIR